MNTATSAVEPGNLTGTTGAYVADFLLQTFGLSSLLLPFFLLVVGWKWIWSKPIDRQPARIIGAILLTASCAATLSLTTDGYILETLLPGGVIGLLASGALISFLNLTGTILVLALLLLLSLYLISEFALFRLPDRLNFWKGVLSGIGAWGRGIKLHRPSAFKRRAMDEVSEKEPDEFETSVAERARERARSMAAVMGRGTVPADEGDVPPFDIPDEGMAATEEYAEEFEANADIPIRSQEDLAGEPAPDPETVGAAATTQAGSEPRQRIPHSPPVESAPAEFRLPSTELLNEPPGRNPYDEQELKDTATAIKAKFEEFNVFGSVVQINHGPVVTTFEFKPDAGVKYSRITNLCDDLCLGLQAESILIERIPGKPTVGIEVPNSKRELISLRAILESDEFTKTKTRLPIPLGKDINGRMRVASLESMPHLLIAGSTGSGKSVMLNSMLMALLYRASPEEVRMVMVDPKQVELGMYEGIPHLLTPVITDPKKASNALRNAVLEMERRLKLLAAQGVRNLEQYNKKIKKKLAEPRSLFPEDEDEFEELQTLPYIVIVIDELSDLMMLERANVEASVTRLAQMARAVGMHLVLATQRPSVDVITGLIKANFPARVSFRVATRVDSRTILDCMGAEHLLGKGDMLFLPPGSSRLSRVHGAFVTENEITGVVNFWKEQAEPDYDESYLEAPISDEDAGSDGADVEFDDPAYQEAVRVVLEMGKASTSILQRRLRLGYGRAARLLDVMQHEGIIGPPDGSRPREVLKAPDWLTEVEEQLR